MNYRKVKKKIKTVQNVQKITRAMQMVAAVKMKRAQDAATQGREYREILHSALTQVLSSVGKEYAADIELLRRPMGTRPLYIVVSSNKGLCGGFNVNLFKYAIRNVDIKNSDFIVFGRKGAEFLMRTGGTVIADFVGVFEDEVSAVFDLCEQRYLEGTNGSISVVYNSFVSSFTSEPVTQQLLPFQMSSVDDSAASDLKGYLIEPSAEELLPRLIEDVTKERIRSAILDSRAAEESARMMAMKNATDSATELEKNLTLVMNTLRQQSITFELLDMIAAVGN